MIIDLGTAVVAPQKAALPIDFTKVIESNRWNLLPKITVPILRDKFDVEIENNVQIPSSDERNQVNKINTETGNINTAKVIPNLGNIAVTNVLPANATVICNLLPIVKSNVPVGNIGSNNSTINVTANIIPTINIPTLNNGVTDNTVITTNTENAILNNNEKEITPACVGSSPEKNVDNNVNKALTDTAKALGNDRTIVVSTIGNVVKDTVLKSNEEIVITETNQVVANTGNLKLLVNSTQSIPSDAAEILPMSNGMMENAGPSLTSTGKITEINAPNAQIVTENTQNVNTNDSSQKTTSTIPPIMYTVLQTSGGSYLIPLSLFQNTNSVNSVTAPIVSTGVSTENTNKATVLNNSTTEAKQQTLPNDYLIPDNTHKELQNHCKCCIVLRRICKDKQTCITDFFKSNKDKKKSCDCTDRKYPKATKRLKLFLKNYKSDSWCVYNELQSKLQLIKKEIQDKEQTSASKREPLQDDYSLEDIGK